MNPRFQEITAGSLLKLYSAVGFFLFVSGLALMSSLYDPLTLYARLAQAMLQGHLSIPHFYLDTAIFQGHIYLPFGPLPAFLLLPAIAIGKMAGVESTVGPTALLNVILVLGCLAATIRLARSFSFSLEDSIWLAFAFCAGSIFLPLIVNMRIWQTAQVAAALFLLLALSEFFSSRRYWLIGIFMALTLASRQTAAIGIIFFIGAIATESNLSWSKKIKLLAELMIPFGVAIVVLSLYNFERFGSFFESGYNYQVLLVPQLIQAKTYGTFSLAHLPGNLYYFFLGHPVPVFRDSISHVLKPPYLLPDPWGMSIFITSPYYLYLFWGSYKDKISRLLWLAAIATALPIFLYYGIGFIQVGYRYALDFMPFLFVIFLMVLPKHKPLSTRLKILFCLSAVANLYFAMTIWQAAPLTVLWRPGQLPLLLY